MEAWGRAGLDGFTRSSPGIRPGTGRTTAGQRRSLMSAWKSRLRFESGRGERAWLASILRRRVADRWRRRPPPTVLGGNVQLEIGQPPEDPTRDQYTDQMQRALDRLTPELRETLLLVVVAELTHQEAADLLGIPLGTVLSRVADDRVFECKDKDLPGCDESSGDKQIHMSRGTQVSCV